MPELCGTPPVTFSRWPPAPVHGGGEGGVSAELLNGLASACVTLTTTGPPMLLTPWTTDDWRPRQLPPLLSCRASRWGSEEPVEADFPGHSMLLLYRDRIREILAREGMESARAAGLAATGRPMPAGVPVEIYVTIAGAHDWSSTDLRRVDQEVADLRFAVSVIRTAGVPRR